MITRIPQDFEKSRPNSKKYLLKMLLKLLSQLGRARVGNRQCFAVILIFINVFLLKMKKPIAYL